MFYINMDMDMGACIDMCTGYVYGFLTHLSGLWSSDMGLILPPFLTIMARESPAKTKKRREK